MGEELGTVYQCHLYGDGEPRKQRCWRWGRPCRDPRPRLRWAHRLLSRLRACFAVWQQWELFPFPES